MAEIQMRLPNICPECSFEAKTPQGLASHRYIKHHATPQVAEKEAQLSAEAVSGVVDDLYSKLADMKAELVQAVEGARQAAAGELGDVLDATRQELAEVQKRLAEAEVSRDNLINTLWSMSHNLEGHEGHKEADCETQRLARDIVEAVAEVDSRIPYDFGDGPQVLPRHPRGKMLWDPKGRRFQHPINGFK